MIAPPRLTPWMIVVMILIGVAICLLGFMTIRPRSGPPSRPPLVMKPLPPRVRRDPVDAFDRLAARGMSEDQLDWVVDDFEAAGLMDAGNDDGLSVGMLVTRQKRWYLEALSAALGLDQAQRKEARAALAALPVEPVAEEAGSLRPLPAGCPTWLTSPAAAPWALCHLTERQEALTGNARNAAAGGEAQSGAATDPAAVLAYFLPVTDAQKQAAEKAGGGEGALFQALHPAQVQLLFLISGPPAWLLPMEDDR